MISIYPDIEKRIEEVNKAINQRDFSRARYLFENVQIADQSDIFSGLSPENQDRIVPHLKLEVLAGILEKMKNEDALQIVDKMKFYDVASIFDHMRIDKAAHIIKIINPDYAQSIIKAMTKSDLIKPLLEYRQNSAGSFMIPVDIKFKSSISVNKAIQMLQNIPRKSNSYLNIFVVDEQNRLKGEVKIQDLAVSSGDIKISEIMRDELIYIKVGESGEKAAKLIKNFNLIALPVLDDLMRLVGIITYDIAYNILEQSATKEIYRLGGIKENKRSNKSLSTSILNRFPWLLFNLFFALISAFIISRFENLISQFTFIVFMSPLVITIGGLFNKQFAIIFEKNPVIMSKFSYYFKDIITHGFIYGFFLGLINLTIVYFWKNNLEYGLILGIATFLFFILNSFLGIIISFGIRKLKINPIYKSPASVSTISEVMGYLLYLTLVSILLDRIGY